MPVLRIHLSESSLARAEEIIRHPRASQNIRGIELVLDYRSESLASDFDLFFQIKINELYKLSDEWEEVKNEVILGEYEDLAPEMLDEEANRIFNAEIKDARIVDDPDYDPVYRHDVLALERWQTVDAAWREERNNTGAEHARDNPKQKMLREGFRRFHAIHQEQHRLVTSGEFTSRVSTICASLPSLGFLIFSDRELATKGPEEEWADLKSRVMFDDDKMLEMLSDPVPWSNAVPEATSAFAPAHAIASKLIWDIPTALYGAGIRLHGLHIRGFPLPGNYDSSRAGDVSPSDADCDNALTRLKSFYTSTQEKAPTILRTNTICET